MTTNDEKIEFYLEFSLKILRWAIQPSFFSDLAISESRKCFISPTFLIRESLKYRLFKIKFIKSLTGHVARYTWWIKMRQ